MKMRNLLLIGGIIALSSIILYPIADAFATPVVIPSERVGGKCVLEDSFRITQDVFVKARGLPASISVDIYVTPNRVWSNGDVIGPDAGDGVDTVLTTANGKISCTKIWANPLSFGYYDIVVDVNKDGVFNAGDAVSERGADAGFTVR